jgi:hypothetical protein
VIAFWCEAGHWFALVFQFHKGATFVQTLDGSSFNPEEECPEELWRDWGSGRPLVWICGRGASRFWSSTRSPTRRSGNADHLLEAGAAIRCKNLPALAWKIDRLLDDPTRLAVMRASARRLARPHAARDIAATLLGTIAQPRLRRAGSAGMALTVVTTVPSTSMVRRGRSSWATASVTSSWFSRLKAVSVVRVNVRSQLPTVRAVGTRPRPQKRCTNGSRARYCRCSSRRPPTYSNAKTSRLSRALP